MPKRLIVCFDGTWNTPDETRPEDTQIETNVRRLYESLLPHSADERRQLAWYDTGVGTQWYERIHGGVFGYGLSENIRQGYTFLSSHYQEGDEIYLFGFSRGAYTARSLVGLIRNCGVLRYADESLITRAYELYRQRDASADTAEARAFRSAHAHTVRIKFLGVWDTVGALGIPVQAFRFLNDARYGFHDMELSSIVEHAYHAVATDEHRKAYDVTLWNPKSTPHQVMEQRWFIGSHSDVGGGYMDRRLSDITLHWMQQKAAACDLAIDPRRVPQVTDDHCLGSLTDSYSAFLRGVFKTVQSLKGEGRHYRTVCQTVYGNEVIDESIRRRFSKEANYRPKNTGFLERVQSHHSTPVRSHRLEEAA